MQVKFIDYHLERKGYWDYGFRYWLTEESNEKKKSVVLMTTNNINQIKEKIKQLSDTYGHIAFEENESFEHHQSVLNA